MANKTVRMRVKISGTRDGQDWPDVGKEITVSASEAKDLISQGYALDPSAPVENALAGVDGVETAVVPAQEGQKSIRVQDAEKKAVDAADDEKKAAK